MAPSRIAVALVHAPVLNRKGESSATSITPMDVHDFARTCAFYGVEAVYLVHPAKAMQAMVRDLIGYWETGEGGVRNAGRKRVLAAVRVVDSLEDARKEGDFKLWFTSARVEAKVLLEPAELPKRLGNHLIVFGTGSGLDVENLPKANGWLSPIAGIGKVRHLSVRSALAIYLDRMFGREG